MTFRQSVYLVLGIINVALGTAGIFLPLLPTTPFLLLAAFLFARSSGRWHSWLLTHPQLSPYIHAFRRKSGLTRSQKLRIGASITVIMWVSIYFSPYSWMRAMLMVMWVFWTLMLMFLVKTAFDCACQTANDDGYPSETPDRRPASPTSTRDFGDNP